jgi:prevent-host-death family protein
MNGRVARYRPVRSVRYHDEQRDGDQYITATDLQRALGEAVLHVQNEQQVLVVIRHNRAAYAVVPIAELERLRRIERRWKEVRADGLLDLDL